ncbi:MAG: hypothetical protein J5737_06350 [Bacteroidales bacterium]|nr:hypothetical protein [Bacteroidales bacterium]
MKKIIYALAALFMVAALSSCDMEIKNVKINNLVGTWDLVSETIVHYDGTNSIEKFAKGENYLVIKKDEIESHTGKLAVTNPFSFGDPYFIIDGTSRYELKSLSYKTMVLRDPVTLLYKEKILTYERR